jgi:hypothetical protein
VLVTSNDSEERVIISNPKTEQRAHYLTGHRRTVIKNTGKRKLDRIIGSTNTGETTSF